MAEKNVMPVQCATKNRKHGSVTEAVHMAAYEVYAHVYGPQKALVTGGCRGGFGVGELIAFLYARSFPREQWSERVDEAFRDLNVDSYFNG